MLFARCQFANPQTSKVFILLFSYSLLFFLNACQFVSNLTGDDDGIPLPFNVEQAWRSADSTRQAQKGWMYADTYTRPYYQQPEPHLLWATERGIDERADTLLHYLREVDGYGLKTSSFHLEEIEQLLAEVRALVPDSCTEQEVSLLQGRLDYLLTESYIRYAYGQRYGYVRPHKLFNNLLPDAEPGQFRRIFDIRCDQPGDSLFKVALQKLEDLDDLGGFLEEVQPTGSLYLQLSAAYQEAKSAGNKERQRLCAINLERSRWRYERPSGGKYVWVNLTDYMLQAVDTEADSVLTMKVCIGDKRHKTPLLASRINRLDFNPYWVIPTSIIKNELVPGHLNDSSYYARNRIVAIDRNTNEQLSPWKLSANQLLSGRYTLRQEKGAGNSLGRMIFRFPNDFAVFLHDTNNPGAFSNAIRALSHGCVRVQKPLELAVFLMDDPDEFTIDKMRIAIGKKPLSEKGLKQLEDEPDYEGMSSYSFSPSIPVYLDYYTLYPEPLGGNLKEHADNYGYDKEIEKILQQF